MEENKQGTGKPTIDKEYLKKLAEKIKAEKARKEAMQKKPGGAPTPPPPPTASIPPTLLDDDDDEEMAEEKTAIIDLASLSGHSADARLTITDGKDQGKSIEITRDEIFVGRGLDNDFVITDPSVSRKHFKVEREDDHFCVSDLGSGNGTRVNGSKITKSDLYHNDVIVAGARHIRFEIINEDMKEKWSRKEEQHYEEEIVYKKKGASPLAWVAIFLVLIGAGAFLYFYMFQPETLQPGRTVAEGPWRLAIEDVDALDDLIENKELETAEKQIKEFLKKAPEQRQLLERLELVTKEKEVQAKFNEGKALFEGNKKAAAEKIFKEIDSESIFYSDVVELVGEETVANWNVEEVKSLIAQNKEDEAFTKIYAILADDPENEEVKELQASLVAKIGQQKAEAMQREAEEKKKAAAAAAASRRARAQAQRSAPRRQAAPAQQAPARQAAPPPRQEPAASGGQADYDRAISQYLSKNFSAAISSLDRAARDRSIAQKANATKKEIERFQRMWERAGDATGTRRSAMISRLIEYDRTISGGKMVRDIEALDKASAPPPARQEARRSAPPAQQPSRRATLGDEEAKTLYMRARSLRMEDPQQARELFQRIIDGTDPNSEYHEKSKALMRNL